MVGGGGWVGGVGGMVGHSFQNYDRVYVGFSVACACLDTLYQTVHELRLCSKLIFTAI